MTTTVVVLGSGYAGAGAIRRLERVVDDEVELVWVSDVDHHLLLHESHRCVRDPAVKDHIAIPIDEIASRTTQFRQATAASIDTADRTVAFEGEGSLAYDYLLVAIGTRTAFYGIDGLETHAHTLKNLGDALGIHEALSSLGREATRTDPGRVVIGGAGLSGIQVAGEIAEYRDAASAPLEIHLVEGLESILPQSAPALREKVASKLAARNVDVRTGSFIAEVDEETVVFDDDERIGYDELIWTGGITGQEAVSNAGLEITDRTDRIRTKSNFRTSDERVFAIGDAALIEQPDGEPAPADAQAAWQAASVAADNIDRAIRDEPLQFWRYEDKGRVLSVGDDAIAHDVSALPFVNSLDGRSAAALKKAIATRWIRHLTNSRRAMRAWPSM